MYENLASAGRALAPHLEPYRGAIVLGIARGGVPAAIEVARHLGAPLDLIAKHGLLIADGKPIGGVTVAGTLVADPRLPSSDFVQEGLDELRARTQLCRGDRAPLDVRDQTLIIVDNGMRTGGTMRLAIQSARSLGAKHIIAAIPAATPESRELIEPLADEVVCLEWRILGNTAMAYKRFDVPRNEEIAGLLPP